MEIIGHQHIWQFLKKTAAGKRISHAYLFFGPEKVGKKTVALEFIKFLNCQEEDFSKDPCGKCRTCTDIEKETYPDLSLVEPQKNEIKISQIRELSWKLSLQSYYGNLKSAIINEAHLMNQEAQNALLKTLEEPSGRTIILLITAFPELLLPTIVSRAERIRFAPVSRKEIQDYLKKKKISQEASDKLISVSMGRPGEFLDFLSDKEKVKERKKKIDELERLINSSLSERFQYAKEESQDLKSLKKTLDIWLRYFREKLISQANDQPTSYSFPKLKKIINLIQDISFLISKTNVNPKLALEILLLEI